MTANCPDVSDMQSPQHGSQFINMQCERDMMSVVSRNVKMGTFNSAVSVEEADYCRMKDLTGRLSSLHPHHPPQVSQQAVQLL